jgi:hemolysin III
MGWTVMVAIKPLIDAIDSGGLTLLVAGGLCYTGGVLFYVLRSLTYHHAIWHLFVLAGSVCHFLAVRLFVIPV